MSTKDVKKNKKNILKYFTIFFIFLLIFKSSFYEIYHIPSDSMFPALKEKDYILVNKFEYGLKIPFSDLSLFSINLNPIYLSQKKGPMKGDIIIFKYPKRISIDFVKRVIGVPGDRIEIKDKVLFLNGIKILKQEILPTKLENNQKTNNTLVSLKNNFKLYKTQIGKYKYLIQQHKENIYTTYLQEITIPKDHFFVMGDNRDLSLDSRTWGLVPRKYIKGKVLLTWYSSTPSLQNKNPNRNNFFRPIYFQ